MFCKKCGKEIMDEAVICVHCGCAVSDATNKKIGAQSAEEDKVSVAIIICTVLLPIVGLILGIVNLCKKKSRSGGIYLGVGIACWILNIIVLSALGF